jgi:hypothetical protein
MSVFYHHDLKMDKESPPFSPILIGTISGGNFPKQLEMLKLLTEMNIKPMLSLGSSGGNVCMYLGMAGSMTPNGIEVVARSLRPEFFIKPWFPWLNNVAPQAVSLLTAYFKGSVYKSSEDGIELFNNFFSPESIVSMEVWVGAVNEKTGSICLFCNKDRENSIIKGNHYNRRIVKSEPLKYLSGNVEKIWKASLASASIPMVTQVQEIDGERYEDGGAKFASPLTALQDEIKAIARRNENRIHMIYLSGYNVEADLPLLHLDNLKDRGMATGDHVVRGMVIHDRLVAYEIVKEVSSFCHNGEEVCRNDGIKVHFVDVQAKAIKEVYSRLHMTECCLFELYPLIEEELDYTKFSGEDVINLMNRTRNLMAGHLWWTGKADIFMGIPGVISEIFMK